MAALKDAEKCLSLDPNFTKAYGRKAQCHVQMKEYHKAMESYEKGLKIDPNSKELMEGKAQTLYKIQTQASSSGGHDEQQMQNAMKDPEI
jgi:stress-induced-phosphoprotein 1